MKHNNTETEYLIFEDVEAAIAEMKEETSGKYDDFFEFCSASLRDDDYDITDYNDKRGV